MSELKDKIKEVYVPVKVSERKPTVSGNYLDENNGIIYFDDDSRSFFSNTTDEIVYPEYWLEKQSLICLTPEEYEAEIMKWTKFYTINEFRCKRIDENLKPIFYTVPELYDLYQSEQSLIKLAKENGYDSIRF